MEQSRMQETGERTPLAAQRAASAIEHDKICAPLVMEHSGRRHTCGACADDGDASLRDVRVPLNERTCEVDRSTLLRVDRYTTLKRTTDHEDRSSVVSVAVRGRLKHQPCV